MHGALHLSKDGMDMFAHCEIQDLDDYFLELGRRRERGSYFYRICGYNQAIQEFLQAYWQAARARGAVVEGKIPNPSEGNLAYYEEVLGMEFRFEKEFLALGLKKWLPRMTPGQQEQLASSMYDTLAQMKRSGKNENMQKNAYVKFMCWLYYRFEQVIPLLGQENLPKILYEGEIGSYELWFLSMLSKAGCDILLLQYHADDAYLSKDPGSKLSNRWEMDGMGPFPEGFSLKALSQEMARRQDEERLYGPLPQVSNCTNAWISGQIFENMQMPARERGTDPALFYNCFCKINGVEDKLTYVNELYQLRLGLERSGREPLVVEGAIPSPSPEEIQRIHRGRYDTVEQMLFDLSKNIRYPNNMELQKLARKAFLDILLEASKKEGMGLNRLMGRAVYLLCWLARYQKELWEGRPLPEVGCFICLGGCKTDREALFLRMLARLPVDVLILNPEQDPECELEDRLLYEIFHVESMRLPQFPGDANGAQMGTVAYHAERELDQVLYQDTGIYRNRQYRKAVSVTLRTMYEEIAILWDQEVKYRPNFSIVDDVVNVPVIFAKVSGVKDGDAHKYWEGIRKLNNQDAYLVKGAPFVRGTDENPVKPHAVEFFKKGKLRRDVIKSHAVYRYGFLREEIQDHILDKLQLLIDQKIIAGTFENGTEYTIIATALNLNTELLRMIQGFDFTRKNPKLIYIHTTEGQISREDTILIAFLHLVGFDVVFFVPTGYRSVEKYFAKQLFEEHQIGEYIYDLRVPDLDAPGRPSWRDKLFKRGGKDGN